MATDVHSLLAPGTVVEVSNLFTGTWSTGFRVVARDAEGYRVERLSDRSVVPAAFPASRLRPVAPMAVPGMGPVAMAGVEACG